MSKNSHRPSRLDSKKGFITVAKDATEASFEFVAPKHSNDLKRLGRVLKIRQGGKTVTLKGQGIQALQTVLFRAGEKIYDAAYMD